MNRQILMRLCWSSAVFLGALLLTQTASADALGDLESPFQSALQEGSLVLALGLVFLAGIGTSLTPCVYPMIAITVSIFGARQAKSKAEGAKLSAMFVLGMATLFTPLGMVAALTGGVFGAALANPYVLAGLALVFIAFAASMFGAFEMNLPMAFRNKLATAGGVGPKGAFVLGLVSALVAAPCTGPVLTVLLTWVSTSKNIAFGAASLFVYALGLGVLFFLVGTFAIGLPKSGKWLEAVKSTFGTVMLVMALYYLKALLPDVLPAERQTAVLVGGVVIFALGIALGAIHLSFHSPSWPVRLRKGVGVFAAVIGAFAVITWLQSVPSGAKIAWVEDLQEARALAQAQGKPLLVDFGASWCGACGELDRHTFSDPRVVSASQGFIAVRVDLSPGEVTPEKKAWLAEYAQKGLPLIVIHDPAGAEVKRFTAFVEPDVFLASLTALSSR